MENEIKTTESEAETKVQIAFSFSNLGIWRKIYLALNWIGCVFMVIIFVSMPFTDYPESTPAQPMVVFVIAILVFAYTFWLHKAMVTRNLTQLLILTIIQVVPLFNPISALIMFLVRNTSKKEREANGMS